MSAKAYYLIVRNNDTDNWFIVLIPHFLHNFKTPIHPFGLPILFTEVFNFV